MAHFLTLKPLQSPQSLIRPTLQNLLFNGYSCWYWPDYISLVLMLFEPQFCLLKKHVSGWIGRRLLCFFPFVSPTFGESGQINISGLFETIIQNIRNARNMNYFRNWFWGNFTRTRQILPGLFHHWVDEATKAKLRKIGWVSKVSMAGYNHYKDFPEEYSYFPHSYDNPIVDSPTIIETIVSFIIRISIVDTMGVPWSCNS
jgi:hypothetical protein